MIARAKLDDVAAIWAIEQASIACPWTLDQITAAMQNPAYLFLVARIDAVVVGYASVRLVESEAEINNIAVMQAFRGNGVGTRLLQELVSQAHARGARTFFLEVASGNATAIGLYQRNGFEKIATRKNYYCEGMDALVYQKNVT